MTPSAPQIRAHKAYVDAGYDVKLAASALNISTNSLKKTLFDAARNGLPVRAEYCGALPVGMGLKAASVLTDGDGNVKLQWFKGQGGHDHEGFAEYVKQRTPVSNLKLPKVRKSNKDLLLEWPIFDPHHGMLAWQEETGADYDHKISRHLQESAAKIIAEEVGRVKVARVILGGDNQTADNRSGKTEKSGNLVDTDTRYAKMAWCCHETTLASIDAAASIADEVEVDALSGNHDYHSAIHLTIQLHSHYRNKKKIKVRTSPARHRFSKWGRSVFMYSHGDIADKAIATYMLNQIIEQNLAEGCKWKHAVVGHKHTTSIQTPNPLTEQDGVFICRFPTLAAQEAYGVEYGYSSVRATRYRLFHRKYGERGGRPITLEEILERYPIEA